MFPKEPYVFLEPGSAIFNLDAQICWVKTPAAPGRNGKIGPSVFTGSIGTSWSILYLFLDGSGPGIWVIRNAPAWKHLLEAEGGGELRGQNLALVLTLVEEPSCYLCTSKPGQSQRLLTQTQNYTARPRLYVSSLVKSPLWLPQSEYAICSLSEPGLKGTWGPGDLGTAILVFLGSQWTSSCPILTITKG